jgi:glycosyltransferase involved in cell wall biosynthesis
LRSVVDQTIADLLELIVVDDASTDDSLATILRVCEGWGTAVVVSRPTASGGPGQPRNDGLDLARGDYVFFLDADDYLAPDAMEVLLDLADRSGSDITSGRFVSFIDPLTGTDATRLRRAPVKPFRENHFREDPYSSHAWTHLYVFNLFRRGLMADHGLRFPADARVWEDQPFMVAAFLLANHVSVFSERPILFLRSRGDRTSTSGRFGRAGADYLQAILGVVDAVEKYATSAADRNRWLRSRLVTYLIKICLARDFRTDREEAARLLDIVYERLAPLLTPAVTARNPRRPFWTAQLILMIRDRVPLDDLLRQVDLGTSDGVLPALTPAGDRASFEFVTSSGRRIAGARPDLAVTLENLDFAETTDLAFDLTCEVTVRGTDLIPTAYFECERRTAGDTVRSCPPASITHSQHGSAPHEHAFSVSGTVSPTLLSPGVWSIFLVLVWDDGAGRTAVSRIRLGKSRSRSLSGIVRWGSIGRESAQLRTTRNGHLVLNIGGGLRDRPAVDSAPLPVPELEFALSEAATLRDYVSALVGQPQVVVCLAVNDTGTGVKRAKAADRELSLLPLGVGVDTRLLFRRSYACVAQAGLAFRGTTSLPQRRRDVHDDLYQPARVKTMVRGVALDLESRGYFAGPSASIRVQGVEHAPNQRGLNFVVLLPGEDGRSRILSAAAFDAWKGFSRTA